MTTGSDERPSPRAQAISDKRSQVSPRRERIRKLGVAYIRVARSESDLQEIDSAVLPQKKKKNEKMKKRKKERK